MKYFFANRDLKLGPLDIHMKEKLQTFQFHNIHESGYMFNEPWEKTLSTGGLV